VQSTQADAALSVPTNPGTLSRATRSRHGDSIQPSSTIICYNSAGLVQKSLWSKPFRDLAIVSHVAQVPPRVLRVDLGRDESDINSIHSSSVYLSWAAAVLLLTRRSPQLQECTAFRACMQLSTISFRRQPHSSLRIFSAGDIEHKMTSVTVNCAQGWMQAEADVRSVASDWQRAPCDEHMHLRNAPSQTM
jgi:hypothetical protein